MKPSKKLLQWMAIWCLLALGLVVFVQVDLLSEQAVVEFKNWWWMIGLFIAGVALFDAWRDRDLSNVTVQRELSGSLALGTYSNVGLEIVNPYHFPLQFQLHEDYPSSVEAKDLPITSALEPDTSQTIFYPVKSIRRGDASFGQTELLVDSRWGLWHRRLKIGQGSDVKIFPNFAPIAHFATLGVEQHIRQLGVHLAKRRGEGLEFHQLREFREGDVLRQIDWKATARQRKPISREYQDERDQDIIFLLDCGRRLRAKDENMSHFDHALNALLMTAYVALRQGDSAGLLSFAGEQRWVSPVKGQAAITAILNQLYDLHSSTDNSDFLQAAEQLMQRHRKRSLVIIISNVRDEDSEDLVAMAGLLSKQHIVMVASLRENTLDQTLENSVDNFSDALNYCGTVQYMQERRELMKRLQSVGVTIVDSSPQQLHVNLVNEYLKMKRSGRL